MDWLLSCFCHFSFAGINPKSVTTTQSSSQNLDSMDWDRLPLCSVKFQWPTLARVPSGAFRNRHAQAGPRCRCQADCGHAIRIACLKRAASPPFKCFVRPRRRRSTSERDFQDILISSIHKSILHDPTGQGARIWTAQGGDR